MGCAIGLTVLDQLENHGVRASVQEKSEYLFQKLNELKEKGLTILLTSHFMDEVEELCDRIGILKDGQFLFCGTLPEAIEKSPYEKLEEAGDILG